MTNEQAIRRISLIMEQPEVPGSLELAYQWVCEDIIESDYDQWIQNDLSEYLAAFPEICSELADESIANGATIEAVAEGLIGVSKSMYHYTKFRELLASYDKDLSER